MTMHELLPFVWYLSEQALWEQVKGFAIWSLRCYKQLLECCYMVARAFWEVI